MCVRICHSKQIFKLKWKTFPGNTTRHGHELRRRRGPVFPSLTQTKCLPVWILPSFPTSLFGAHTCLSLCLFDWLAVCLTWYFLLVSVSLLVPVGLSGLSGLSFCLSTSSLNPVSPSLLTSFCPLFYCWSNSEKVCWTFPVKPAQASFPVDLLHVTLRFSACKKKHKMISQLLFYWFFVLICLFQVY